MLSVPWTFGFLDSNFNFIVFHIIWQQCLRENNIITQVAQYLNPTMSPHILLFLDTIQAHTFRKNQYFDPNIRACTSMFLLLKIWDFINNWTLLFFVNKLERRIISWSWLVILFWWRKQNIAVHKPLLMWKNKCCMSFKIGHWFLLPQSKLMHILCTNHHS